MWFVTSDSFCAVRLFLDGSSKSSHNYLFNLFLRFICPEMFQEIRIWVWGVCICVCAPRLRDTLVALGARSRHGVALEGNHIFAAF